MRNASYVVMGLLGAFFVSLGIFQVVSATTTIGTDIATDGALTITGTSTLQSVSFAYGTSTGWLGFATASGTTVRAGSMIVNGSSVCLANGTNCPTTPTLAQITAIGSSSTNTLQLYSGFLAASSTVTSTFTVLGTTSLQSVSAVNVTSTSWLGFSIASGTSVYASAVTSTSLTVGNGSQFTVDSSGTVSTTLQTGPWAIGGDLHRLIAPIARSRGSSFTSTSGTAYAVYLGYTNYPKVIKYVRGYLVSTNVAAGSQTAEVALASTPSGPNGTSQTLTKLVADGTLTTLTSASVEFHNSTAFSSGTGYTVAAGTHLWAVVRISMGTTQTLVDGSSPDYNQGMVLTATGVGALTSATTWSGSVPSSATLSPGISLMATMD